MRPEGRKGKRIRKKFKTKSDAVLYERWVLAQQHNKSGKETPLIAVRCQCLLTCGGNTTAS